MKNLYSLSLLTVAAWLAAAPCQALVITFTDQTTFDSQFPAATRVIGGSNSSVSLAPGGTPDHVSLYAQETVSSATSQVTIYSASSLSSNMDFVSSAKTFVFNGAVLSFTSPGSTYNANFGVVNANSGAMQQTSGPDDGVYFRINRTSASLDLIQKLNDTVTTLQSWSVTDNVWSFTSLSLTLSATDWSVSGQSTSGVTVVSGAGTFATTWSSSNWGTNFYLGMQVFQSTSSTTRFAQLDMGSIDINAVPEPGATAMLLGGIGLLALLNRRRRS